MKLYSYWRSSSSWRVRWALETKGIEYDYEAVHLVEDGGHQHQDWYREKNPMEQVPLLEFEQDGEVTRIGQSMAIIEYLEDTQPDPSVWPDAPVDRAHARQLAEIVNSGIQPLQNPATFKRVENDKNEWCRHWIRQGLLAYQKLARQFGGHFSVGDRATTADACLIPQMYNARRFDLDMSEFPVLLEIEDRCSELRSFQKAHPSQQPDAQS